MSKTALFQRFALAAFDGRKCFARQGWRWLLPFLSLGLAGPIPADAADPHLIANQFSWGLNRPVYLTTPAGDNSRLFVLEQHTGRIRIVDKATGQVSPTPFLEISDVSDGNEQGLLGLAFAPDYAQSGRFFVNYTDAAGNTQIVGYRVSATDPNKADPRSETPILTINQPQANHNGGWIGFSPKDNYLYIAMGDGGAGNDSGTGHTANIGNGQDITNNLLGKMLRIDVSRDAFPSDVNRNYAIPPNNPFVGVDGDDEIWAYGLRNPWRNSFDRQTGDLYIADVGQTAKEEVNFQPANSSGGANYGWRLREGTVATPNVGGPKPPGVVDPIFEYGRDSGMSITGGYVYRGPIPELRGEYFAADFVTNKIWTIQVSGQTAVDVEERTDNVLTRYGRVSSIASFGEDNDGNLYVVSLGGLIYRLDDVVYPTTLVPEGSTWKYLDDGSNQGTNWRTTGFNDSAWKQGRGQLGFGEGDEATVISSGASPTNRPVTSYFRHSFQVSDPKATDQLLLELLYDDGAAVYINGQEVARTINLANNAAYDTLANNFGEPAIDGEEENRFQKFLIPSQMLVAGTNLLAVEMHQHSRSSDDLSFDLRLSQLYTNDQSIEGDFNQDGFLDSTDIDLLGLALRNGNQESIYDVNNDQRVNSDDYQFWIASLKRTWRGDATMDGQFQEHDLIQVMQAGQYEDTIRGNSRWWSGDWNGDAEFTTADLVASFQDGGYLRGARAVAIPEPSSWGLLSVASLCGLLRRRSHGSQPKTIA